VFLCVHSFNHYIHSQTQTYRSKLQYITEIVTFKKMDDQNEYLENQSCNRGGAFRGLASQTNLQAPTNGNMKHYKSVEFL